MSRMSRKKTAECKMKDSKDPNAKMRRTTGSGYLKKQGVSYAAGLCFDAIDIYTKTCDLQTSLEFLMVLTAVKQKMRDPESASASFEERLQGALMSSAKEHGKDLADLNLRFCILQTTGFLIKPGFLIRSPTVRSAEELGKLRALLEPFRRYGRYALSSGRKNLFWRFSPAQMQDAWEKFQKAVADAWNIAGADSTGFLQKVRAIHEAEIEHRTMDLQKWEREHMALQDKNKHRPTKLRERNGFAHLERWERQQMAMEDKNKRRPQKLREINRFAEMERWERRQMALEDKNRHRPKKLGTHLQSGRSVSASRKFLVLKRLLARWERMLDKEAAVLDKERRRVLQRRKAQQKKAQEERRRLEALNQKRLKEEERLRREALRKRMRSNLTMEDLFKDGDAHKPDKKDGQLLLKSLQVGESQANYV